MKHNNIHIMGKPEGEVGEQGIENLYGETTTENFLDLVKEKDKSRKLRDSQTKWVQRVLQRDTS